MINMELAVAIFMVVYKCVFGFDVFLAPRHCSVVLFLIFATVFFEKAPFWSLCNSGECFRVP